MYQNKYEVIDFHTHIFPTRVAPIAIKNLSEAGNANPFYNGTIEGLIENMKKNGVDLSICLPIITNPRHTVSINSFAMEVNKNYKEVISFGSLSPFYDDNDNELIRLKENGIKGIKLHPVYQKCPIDSDLFINLINKITAQGMYVIIHAGEDPGFPGDDCSSVERLENMLNKIDDESKIILAHLGGLFEFEKSYEKLAGRNIYLDTAMSFKECRYRDGTTRKLISDELFIKLVRKHGSDKILLGSDNPWSPSDEVVDYLMNSNLTTEEKENILYKNAKRILNLR